MKGPPLLRELQPEPGGGRNWLRHPALPYVGPFGAFLVILGVQDHLARLGGWEASLRFAVMGLIILVLSRRVLDFRLASPAATVLVGVAVFLIWIAPDKLWPGMREHWLFTNSLTGTPANQFNARMSASSVFLLFRVLRSIVIVPIVEELFWRGWLMRWLIRTDFESVPIGAYARGSFWITALLFAVEHGSFWDVGFAAGILYGLWVVRTKRLGDCILAHAVTNACLSAYVILRGEWRYWP